MIQTILFATDLGWFSPHIMQHVITLAAKCDAQIVVVHAVEPLSVLGAAVVKSLITAETKTEEDARLDRMRLEIKNRVIDAYTDEYMQGDEELARIADVVIEHGRPAEVILNEAAKYEADLIVMGRHGQHCMDPNILGSVTSKVLQLAKVPVYMVPVMRVSMPQQKAV